MGNQSHSRKLTTMRNKTEEINRNSFDFISLIGRGGYSKVWKVRLKKSNNFFASKEISKARVIDKKCVKAILLERELLSKINHPFIVNMHFSFQDFNSLYLVMDLVIGKDLRYHLVALKQFSEEQTKFFIASTLLSLEYLHTNNIIHRDIKPENLILNEKGYLKLTDFGIAKKVNEPFTPKEVRGTPEYMAPELLYENTANISSDYYSLGIMAYEFMKGIRPYLFQSKEEFTNIINKIKIIIKKHDLPDGWSIESADFINRLLAKKPSKRLGYGGTNEVKNHVWFRNFEWEKLYDFKMSSPLIPNIPSVDWIVEADPIDHDTIKKYKKIMASKDYKTVFKNFLYFNIFDKNLNNDNFINPHDKDGKVQIANAKNKINNMNKSHCGYTATYAGTLTNYSPMCLTPNFYKNTHYNLNLNLNNIIK